MSRCNEAGISHYGDALQRGSLYEREEEQTYIHTFILQYETLAALSMLLIYRMAPFFWEVPIHLRLLLFLKKGNLPPFLPDEKFWGLQKNMEA